jgi:alpha-ribazole phosphatase
VARFLLIRHGESVWNGERRIQGHRDPPLSALGRRQADRLVAALPAHLTSAVAAVWTSPLRRAAETAARIGQAFGLPVVPDPDLREMSLGAWEGMTRAEIEAGFPGVYARWLDDPLAGRPDGGEELSAFAARAAGALERMRTAYPGRDLIVVSHGGVIKSLLCAILGLDVRRLFRIRQDNSALNIVELAGARQQVVLLNDTCHLRLGGEELAAPSPPSLHLRSGRLRLHGHGPPAGCA